ncbi:hypothetical protein LTR66_000762 [Elasticomyces elasticus]|nr:hypothetical protein LTR66_000762 [Elasticomyces elasticus]
MDVPDDPGQSTRDEGRERLGDHTRTSREVLRRASPSKDAEPQASVVLAEEEERGPQANDGPETVPAPDTVVGSSLPDTSEPDGPNLQASRPTETPEPPQVEGKLVADDYSFLIPRTATQREKARALFAKYSLTLDTEDWPADTVVEQKDRVEKPIRIRLRRVCHRCGTSFGTEKVCAECTHTRCKKCPRTPAKKVRETLKAAAQNLSSTAEPANEPTPQTSSGVVSDSRAIPPLEPDSGPQDIAEPNLGLRSGPLTIQAHVPSGSELVHRKTTQRIRRTCHKCNSSIIPPSSPACAQCQHRRCTLCPRDPPKLHKWPNGYPGDGSPSEDERTPEQAVEVRRVYRRPKQRLRWSCEQCRSPFVDSTWVCASCGHERCEQCLRDPPKKVRVAAEPDPDVVRIVEERLANLNFAISRHQDTVTTG